MSSLCMMYLDGVEDNIEDDSKLLQGVQSHAKRGESLDCATFLYDV